MYLGKIEITGTVVTMPAFFKEKQIAATKRAFELAGLELRHWLHEPTAAAIAYNAIKSFDGPNIFIFDFGGGI